jgi:hypothetical protein
VEYIAKKKAIICGQEKMMTTITTTGYDNERK